MALNESATTLAFDDEAAYVDWPAVFGGVIVSAAGLLLLTSVGTALGLASVSPWTSNPSGTTLGLAGAAWFAICALYAGGVGGYIVGRLRKPADDSTADERSNRDGLNGLISWGLGLLVSAIVTTSILATGLGKAVDAAANVAGPTLSEAVKQSTSQASNALSYYVDRATRSTATTPNSTGDVSPEITRLLTRSLTNGSLSDDDRSYLAKLVAQKASISEADAKGRVDQMLADANAAYTDAVNKAKDAADKARKLTAAVASWFAIISFCAAILAWYAAIIGGRHRDLQRLV